MAQKKAETPWHKDDVLEVTIEDMDQDGNGIGHTEDGYTLFIKDAVIGDKVTAKVMKATPKYAFAKLEEITERSPFRVEPKCDISNKCGGCQIQSLDYEHQLAFKERKVRGDLIRIGGFPAEKVDEVLYPIIGMDDPFRYRNKEQVPVGMSADGIPLTGFYAGRTHSIVPMTDCMLGAEDNKKILEAILEYMKLYHVPAYDEKTGEGLLRHILIRNGVYSQQTMVCLVVNGDSLPEEDKLVEMIRVLPNVTSISLNVNRAKTNVILGRKLRVLWGEDSILDSLHIFDVREHRGTDAAGAELPTGEKAHTDASPAGSAKDAAWGNGKTQTFVPTGTQLQFRISPLSFYQVNPKQTEKMYSLALDYAALTGKEYVLDLYCGIGTISLFLAKRAKEVYGIEVVPEAVRDAKINAERNGISNALFETGRAEDVLPAFVERRRKEGRRNPVDVVVVDPPRKGLDDGTIDIILKLMPKRVVYVSCDPATLARDLKKLCEKEYELRKVTPVDNFCNSVHVETVVLLSNKMRSGRTM